MAKVLITIAVDEDVICQHFETSKRDLPKEAREGVIMEFVNEDLRNPFEEKYDGELQYNEDEGACLDFYLEGFEWPED